MGDIIVVGMQGAIAVPVAKTVDAGPPWAAGGRHEVTVINEVVGIT